MRAIFLSYRKDDTDGHAHLLYRNLCERFGEKAVFMDVAGIAPGRDFRRAIEEQLASCGVLLALIGKDWVTVAEKGRRRLDDPTDYVRFETATALKRDIPVVPVLVQGAGIPREKQLPPDLKPLAFRKGVALTHERWDSDVQVLIKALLPHVDAVPEGGPIPPPSLKEPPKRWWRNVAVASVLVIALGAGIYLAFHDEEKPAVANTEMKSSQKSGDATTDSATEPAAKIGSPKLTTEEQTIQNQIIDPEVTRRR